MTSYTYPNIPTHINITLGQDVGETLPTATTTAQVPLDLLGGIGNFTVAGTYVDWTSYYTNIVTDPVTGLDYTANPKEIWTYPMSDDIAQLNCGFVLSGTTDETGVGWCRRSSATIHPTGNIKYQLADGEGVSGTVAQYFGITGATTGSSWIGLVLPYGTLITNLSNTASTAYPTWCGRDDTLELVVDHLKISENLENIPGIIDPKIYIRLATLATLPADNQTSEYAYADITSTETQSLSTTLTITGTTNPLPIYASTYISYSGTTPSTADFGIYIDNIHVYVVRDGSRIMVNIPSTGNGSPYNIASFTSACIDIYKQASLNSSFMAFSSIGQDTKKQRLNYYNPNCKYMMYITPGRVIIATAQALIDAENDNLPAMPNTLGFYDVANNNPEWLISGGLGVSGFVYFGSYPTSYYTNFDNSEYINASIPPILEKLQRHTYTYMFVDDTTVLTEYTSSGLILQPERLAWMTQNMIKSLCTSAHALGYYVWRNAYGENISDVSSTDELLVKQNWVPTATYPASDGYTANTADNSTDGTSNEIAFSNYAVVDSASFSVNGTVTLGSNNDGTGDKIYLDIGDIPSVYKCEFTDGTGASGGFFEMIPTSQDDDAIALSIYSAMENGFIMNYPYLESLNYVNGGTEVSFTALPAHNLDLITTTATAITIATTSNTVVSGSYASGYWVDCINDMHTIEQWNETNTRPQYLNMYVKLKDPAIDPAIVADNPNYPKQGWAYFGLASYLLGENAYTSLGMAKYIPGTNSETIYLDYTPLASLGTWTSTAVAVTEGKDAFQKRTATNGIVLANSYATNKTWTATNDCRDAYGTGTWDSGNTVTLPPHTGGILIFT